MPTIEEIRKEPNPYEIELQTKELDEDGVRRYYTIDLRIAGDSINITDTDGGSICIIDADIPMLIAKLQELYPE